MGKGLSEGMQYAKQLYLYGDGKKKPVKNITKLAELTGVSERGIRRHLPEWRQSSTEMAVNNPDSPYSLSLSEETLSQHRAEIDFLGRQVVKIRLELKSLTPDQANYHVLLSSYERALTKWEKSSGIVAYHATAEAGMKEKARAHEREKAKQGGEGKKKVMRKVDKSRFDI